MNKPDEISSDIIDSEMWEAMYSDSEMHQYQTDRSGNIIKITTTWNDGTIIIETPFRNKLRFFWENLKWRLFKK